jgi:hypothetical protein
MFKRSPVMAPKPRRQKSGPVLCVGWKAFVHWPKRIGGTDDVPLADREGKALPNDFVDGQQVEILSWRPRSRDGLLYEIRRVADGREGWIVAHHLRREATAVEEDSTHE